MSQQQMTLLERGIGIWPTQLPRYVEVVLMLEDEIEDNIVQQKQIDDPRPPMFGDWQELIHPLGGTYYYNHTKKTYTSMNLRTYQDLQMLNNFIDASRAAAQEDGWLLVVHPTMFMGEKRFQYYYVVPDQRIIAWLEELNGYILFREGVNPSKWPHKRLELEAQYWRHFEFFPHSCRIETSVVRRLRREIGCYLGEAITLSQSTAASMFWTLDQMNQIVAQLANIEGLVENGLLEETSIVFCCRILYILRTYDVDLSAIAIKHDVGHHQYLNRHNQPEARLIRSHAVREKRKNNKILSAVGSAAVTILCMPITIERIRNTSVDGIVNGIEVRRFVDDFSSQARNQITLAGASMAMDIAIFTIPGLGASTTAQTLCSCSLLVGVGCIFAGTMVQRFGERMGSLEFAGYYLRKRRMMLVVITSIPTFFCVLSVIGAMLGFLAGIFANFKPSTFLVVSNFVMLSVVVCLLLVLAIASYGPGLARMRPQ
ncbi:uncharacterized protein F5891DRAFT_1196569 [Suillus fuscotomentosus]|uniref:Uncharacterized protein n=1 Tax=Suillus fuscotomentosus TaxID=1912939 RepID=A0AAD4HEA1_9AGAM|nr:uncharacterized protein F5891DRAFT_1196569 [Suillus fuscotomentosus]KAG1893337.1 hypothetical protein F5891DRAFT_1196569 [Suillus fuscotomentosus]